MSNVTVHVGLDYHKASVQVCVMDGAGRVLANRACRNRAEDLAALVARYGDDVRAGIEACAGAADLADELAALGWSISLAHPGYVARMKQTPDKTDWADARVIADLVRVNYLPKVWLAPEGVRQLRTLTRHRRQLAAQRRDAKLRVSALLREHRVAEPEARRWGKAWRAWLSSCEGLGTEGRWVADRLVAEVARLEGAIAEVEARLAEVTAGDAVVAALRGLSGVGPVTAYVLRAEVGRFDRFATGKQLSRYCGLSPRNASSGQRQADAGLIKAGNEHLRAVIIEAAHRLVRHDARWRALAASLRKAGKPACVIAAAVANRWIRWLYHRVTAEPVAPAPAG
ncbi:MAG: IS110 family transposase [Thermoleophilia bacterium]|nr:IS110 family transposase [Thermoleophilia bacterium]